MIAEMSFPWLWPYGDYSVWPWAPDTTPVAVAERLNALACLSGNTSVRFVESDDNLSALDYERQVSCGHVPTRNLAHDWYNGQVWLGFSGAKKLLNTRHVEDARRITVRSSNGRSRLRDALTLFDESGALLLSTDSSLCDALMSHDWQSLFVDNRANWALRARVLIVGHGLLEALHKPHPALCAKAVPVLVPSIDLDLLQLQKIVEGVCGALADPANLSPLPVMGVPGWFAESDSPGYYDNSAVYRAKPTRKGTSQHERLAFVWDGATLALGKCAGQSPPEFQGEESPDSSEHGAG